MGSLLPGFFGFLRSGEMTVPSQSGYDPDCHLSYGDIAVDSPRNPQGIRVAIKQSKTDPFRKGIDLYIGKTSTDVCPVKALHGGLCYQDIGEVEKCGVPGVYSDPQRPTS